MLYDCKNNAHDQNTVVDQDTMIIQAIYEQLNINLLHQLDLDLEIRTQLLHHAVKKNDLNFVKKFLLTYEFTKHDLITAFNLCNEANNLMHFALLTHAPKVSNLLEVMVMENNGQTIKEDRNVIYGLDKMYSDNFIYEKYKENAWWHLDQYIYNLSCILDQNALTTIERNDLIIENITRLINTYGVTTEDLFKNILANACRQYNFDLLRKLIMFAQEYTINFEITENDYKHVFIDESTKLKADTVIKINESKIETYSYLLLLQAVGEKDSVIKLRLMKLHEVLVELKEYLPNTNRRSCFSIFKMFDYQQHDQMRDLFIDCIKKIITIRETDDIEFDKFSSRMQNKLQRVAPSL